jgi:hypothetical protein
MTYQETQSHSVESVPITTVLEKPKPQIGVEIACAETDILFLGSNVPCVRVVEHGGVWIPNPDPRRGLVVRVLKPTRLHFKGGIRIRITAVHVNFAHAEAILD